MISVKTGGDKYLASPSVVYNLNLGHFLTTFSTVKLTSRNTAFSVYIPATKAIILVAGYKGFKIESFANFQLTIKNGKRIDILVTTKDVDQILIVDGQDKLRFAHENQTSCKGDPFCSPVQKHCQSNHTKRRRYPPANV